MKKLKTSIHKYRDKARIQNHIDTVVISGQISIQKIVMVVCDYFGVGVEKIGVKTRKREILQARQIAHYFCKELIPDLTYEKIGQQIGGKDGCTARWSREEVVKRIETEPEFRKAIEEIEDKLKS